jgi:hypothetical protein
MRDPIGRFSVIGQCLRALNDVPHDSNCAAGRIRDDFPCGCSKQIRIAAGLEAVIKRACSLRFKRLTNEARAETLLEWFVKAASRPIKVVAPPRGNEK